MKSSGLKTTPTIIEIKAWFCAACEYYDKPESPPRPIWMMKFEQLLTHVEDHKPKPLTHKNVSRERKIRLVRWFLQVTPTPQQITQARCKAGLSMEQAAELMGCTRMTVHNWESGKHKMPQAAWRLFEMLLKGDK